MSLLTRLLPNVLNTQLRVGLNGGQAFSLTPVSSSLDTFVRTIVRNHFPRPSERKRVKRHGWAARMATPEGRRVLMNRILKGRYVYSH